MTLEEMVNGITGESMVDQDSPLAMIGSLLDEEEKADIRKVYQKIRLGISLFSGQVAAGTDTVPWVVKEQDLLRVIAGQTPISDFTITALLHYFDNALYSTFEDKLSLAHKIAGARERYVLQDELYRLYEARDKMKVISKAAREIAIKEYTKKLKDPDDIVTMRFVLGLSPESQSSSPVRQIDSNLARSRQDQRSWRMAEQQGIGDRVKGTKILNDERRDTKDELGGIDMNVIDFDRQGAGVDIQFDPAELQEIIDAGIDGFAPVIINITPLPSVLPLLGLEPATKEEKLEEKLEVSSLN